MFGALDADDHHPQPIFRGQGVEEFDEAGRMTLSVYYDRLVDVMEELMKVTLLTRSNAAYLVDRYSERNLKGREPAGAEHLAAPR